MLLELLACGSPPSPAAPASSLALIRHPEVATVLVASWEQRVAGESWLSWEVEGQPMRSPPRARQPGPASEVVLGAPAETEVEQIALHVLADGEEHSWELGSLSTGPLPEDLLEGELVAMDEAQMRPEPWLLASIDVGEMPFHGPWYTVILDRQGRVVWYLLTPGNHLTWQPRVARTGDALLLESLTVYSFVEELPPTVTRMTLDRVSEQTTVLPGMSLAYAELPDSSWLYEEREDAADSHLVRQDAAGNSTRLWSCGPWMAEYRWRPDNCATNTVVWSEARGTVLWSCYEEHTVVEIDAETGELLREFGRYPGGFSFDPPEADFEHQHYPHWTAQGTLLLSAHDPLTGQQVAREYEVDDATSTLRLLWSVQTEHYAEYGGQIQALASGNLLWQLGTAGVMQEITREGEVVWQVQWPGVVLGNLTVLDDLYALTHTP
jgi:hypothetical protein